MLKFKKETGEKQCQTDFVCVLLNQLVDLGMDKKKISLKAHYPLWKMSNYPKGDWQSIWDGLFWRFMHKHRDFFLSNPRLGMLIRTFDKMPTEKQQKHIETAENYLETLN